jgi:hypothetical protein
MGYQINKKIFLQYFIVIFIFVVFAFLRFYQLEQRTGFDWDQERDAYEVKKILVEHKPTLIGPRVVNTNGFFLGPYYTYVLTPFYILSNLHPIGSVYFIVFTNIVFFAAGFFIIKKLFDFKTSLFFLALCTLNFVATAWEITAWNVLLVPLGILLVFMLLHQLYEKKQDRDWFLLGLVLCLGINFHFQFIFLVLFSIFFLLLRKKDLSLSVKKIIVCIMGFMLPLAPLALFDIRHDFINIQLLFSFFTTPDSAGTYIFSWVAVLTNVLRPFIIIKSDVISVVLYITLIAMSLYLAKKHTGFQKTFFSATIGLLLTVPFFFIVYGKRPSEYYFLFLYPFIYLILTSFFYTIRKQTVLIVLLVLYTILNASEIAQLMRTSPYSLYYKDKAIQTLKTYTKDKTYNISFKTELGRNNGFKYLIDHYELKQSNNWSDPLVEIVIPPEKGNIKVGQIGLKIPWIKQ